MSAIFEPGRFRPAKPVLTFAFMALFLVRWSFAQTSEPTQEKIRSKPVTKIRNQDFRHTTNSNNRDPGKNFSALPGSSNKPSIPNQNSTSFPSRPVQASLDRESAQNRLVDRQGSSPLNRESLPSLETADNKIESALNPAQTHSTPLESNSMQLQELDSSDSANTRAVTESESETAAATDSADQNNDGPWAFKRLTDRATLPSTIQMLISVAAISLVPAILLMTTCFVRIVVVLGILRQSIGLQQLPPTQVTTALALMMTFLIMAPTWKQIKEEAIDPYSAQGSTMSWDEAWNSGVTPIKKFMWAQILRAENENDFWVFYDYLPEEERSKPPESYSDLPLKVLLPAFMISELKVAFLIGLQVLLPFLILDIVAASLCNTLGLIMLPPTVVSLPLKLLLFVMVDGWNLVVAMLLNSFSL